MRFSEFSNACKFAGLTFTDDSHVEIIDICKKPGRIPQGQSWGICDEEHCPYFGIKGRKGTIYIDGQAAGAIENCKIVLGQE